MSLAKKQQRQLFETLNFQKVHRSRYVSYLQHQVSHIFTSQFRHSDKLILVEPSPKNARIRQKRSGKAKTVRKVRIRYFIILVLDSLIFLFIGRIKSWKIKWRSCSSNFYKRQRRRRSKEILCLLNIAEISLWHLYFSMTPAFRFRSDALTSKDFQALSSVFLILTLLIFLITRWPCLRLERTWVTNPEVICRLVWR